MRPTRVLVILAVLAAGFWFACCGSPFAPPIPVPVPPQPTPVPPGPTPTPTPDPTEDVLAAPISQEQFDGLVKGTTTEQQVIDTIGRASWYSTFSDGTKTRVYKLTRPDGTVIHAELWFRGGVLVNKILL